jgi:hypothetical protein
LPLSIPSIFYAEQYWLKPVVRIFEEDVLWEKEGDSSNAAKKILHNIQQVINKNI